MTGETGETGATVRGHDGAALTIAEWGDPADPAVLLVPDGDAGEWDAVAAALAEAGRHVVTYARAGAARSQAMAIGDLVRVLEDMAVRPVVIARGLAATIAVIALGECRAPIASGLVRIGAVADGDARGAAARAAIAVPQADVDAAAGDELVAVLLEFLERAAPRAPLLYESGADARTLRDALGCFATGITIVTTLDADGGPVGLTVNSFASVSLDPPLILVSIARSASSVEMFEVAPHFAINVLHIGQQPASDRFARRAEDRFAATPHEAWKSGVPIISGSLASFECRRHAVHDGGDHLILIGRVERAQFAPQRDPLLYFRGRYRRLHFG